MKRAAFINAWELDRHIGFMTAYWTDHFGLAAGIFGEGGSQSTGSIANTPFFPGFIGDENLVFAARGSVAPINREVNGLPQVLAFGGSVRTRDVGDDAAYLQYRARGADFHMTNFALSSGRVSEGDTFWGLEAAALVGPISLQGEYGHLDVDLPGGTFIRNNSAAGTPTAPNPFIGIPDPEQTGWYIEGGWFFGGHKTYNKEGRWDRPKIDNPMRWSEHNGWGAVQLSGRYDVLDMSDIGNNTTNTTFNLVGACQASLLWPGVVATGDNPPTQRVAQCGEMKTWTIGLNWYLNDYTRLMFDYSQSDLGDYPITPASVNTGGTKAGFDGATIRGFGMRAQVDW